MKHHHLQLQNTQVYHLLHRQQRNLLTNILKVLFENNLGKKGGEMLPKICKLLNLIGY